MEFESEEAAKVFYDAYATRVGFIMRVDAFRRSIRDGKVVWRRFVCNKEGFRKPRPRRSENRKPRAITREGCKALIVVKKEKRGKWVVTRFVKGHNHQLVPITTNCQRMLLSQTPIPMASNASNASSGSLIGSTSTPAKSDPAWVHCKKVPGKRNQTICLYCNKHLQGGGITRLKQHIAGVSGEVGSCSKVPSHVQWQMKQLLSDLKKEQSKRKKLCNEIGNLYSDYVLNNEDEGEHVNIFTPPSVGSEKAKGKGTLGSIESKRRKLSENYFAPRTTPGAQPSIKTFLQNKDAIQQAKMAMARWWFDANIPFSAANSKYYQPMIDAIAAIGHDFEAPSFYEFRGVLLKDCVHEVDDYLLDIKNSWKTYGCSILSDVWTNQRQEPIINFFVYSPRGSIFLKSVDASGLTMDANSLFQIFDEIVQQVGSENVVQFITNNDASYKAAGRKLQDKYITFFWTPCAAHCIDLMLESFANFKYFPIIDQTIQKARKITKFIYNHGCVLSLMRKDYTNGRDLCRPAITRYATHFLSIQCLMKFKKELRQMFTGSKWVESCYAKSSVGKEVATIILDDKEFWCQCQHIVKVSEPLVKVLRLVDGEEKPSMGYLYEAIDKAKDTITARFKNKVSLYMPYLRVIDAIWEKQLSSPLHMAGCLLNPSIFFAPSFELQNEVTRGFLNALTRLVSKDEVQDTISAQLEEYKKSNGDFGMSLAIRQRGKLNPVSWWEQFGNGTPELQKFAIRVLSQCTSATGCERNWSIFEFVHSKKQNRLEHKRLNDLVYVRYNLKLLERNLAKGKEFLDPISCENIDILEDWVAEEKSLFDNNDLDMDWANVKGPLVTSKDIDEEVVFDEDDEVIAPPNESQFPWDTIFTELEDDLDNE